MPLDTPFLIYGSYGYTGSLIVDLAVSKGMRPSLSGRDPLRLKAQADSLGLDYRSVSLEDRPALEDILGNVPLVLNCAGPFSHTYKPMTDACLKLGRHYLDITGEIKVFEALARLDAQARNAGLMLLPGIGFDVVPSDCLAMHLHQRMPDAIQLTIGIKTLGGGFSRGTALTGIEGFSGQGLERKDGKLVQVPLFSKTRQIDFGIGLRTAISSPWGDLSTGYYSTGIPNIETYIAFKESFIRWMRFLRPLVGIARIPAVQRFLKRRVMQMPAGPSDEKRQLGHSRLWGEVTNSKGARAVSRMETPEAYSLTARTAVEAVQRVLSGECKTGFQTPAMAFGADFILGFDGVKREDIL